MDAVISASYELNEWKGSETTNRAADDLLDGTAIEVVDRAGGAEERRDTSGRDSQSGQTMMD